MKAQELRIGNLIYSHSRLFPTEIIKVKPYVIDWQLKYSELKNFEPIPLTEEWLLKLGFDFGSDFIGECFFIEFDDKNDFFIHIENDKFYYNYDEIEIKHVHQLQNLYFALTNNELEIL